MQEFKDFLRAFYEFTDQHYGNYFIIVSKSIHKHSKNSFFTYKINDCIKTIFYEDTAENFNYLADYSVNALNDIFSRYYIYSILIESDKYHCNTVLSVVSRYKCNIQDYEQIKEILLNKYNINLDEFTMEFYRHEKDLFRTDVQEKAMFESKTKYLKDLQILDNKILERENSIKKYKLDLEEKQRAREEILSKLTPEQRLLYEIKD